MNEQKTRAGALAAGVFFVAMAGGTPFVLLAHERDMTAWRRSADEALFRVGTHFEHTITDVTREVQFLVARDAGHLQRLPRMVQALRLVSHGQVVLDLEAPDADIPAFSCESAPLSGARIASFETYPRLCLEVCVNTSDSSQSSTSAPSWLAFWIQADEVLHAAGLRALQKHGFDYRLSDESGEVAIPLEISRNGSWEGAVRREIALPSGKWVLELQTRDRAAVHASLLSGGVVVVVLSGLAGLFAYRGGSKPAVLRTELERTRERIASLDARLLDEYEKRRAAEEQLERGARYDELTRLPNRSFFLERVKNVLDAQRRRPRSTPAVLIFDVTQLRRINESMGRAVGDQVLRGVARRIEEGVQAEDIVARAGADQFAVLLFQAPDLEGTVGFVEALLQEIERPFALGGMDVFVTCSVGIVLLEPSYERPENVLRDAMLALNQARASEGRKLQIFGEEMHARALRLIEIENDLRLAVDRGEMVAYYQPILSLENGRIIGFETLARWRHPQRGIVSPADFIPIAEQTGIIIQIDRWNLTEGARQLAVWQDRFPRESPLELSANLAANEMSRPDIVDFVASVLQETGLNPGTLAIEVTESGVMKSPETAAVILKHLDALGVHLHLDDFGTGYSSLAYLQRFSFDLLKIDRAFVGSMMRDRKSFELVKTVLALSRALDMDVVAEGIETEEQLKELRTLACPKGQGFLFSRPVPANEIDALLAEDRSW